MLRPVAQREARRWPVQTSFTSRIAAVSHALHLNRQFRLQLLERDGFFGWLMNENRTVPPFAAAGSSLAAIPLPLLIGGAAIVALAVWLFSDKKKIEVPLNDVENGNTGTKPPMPPPVSALSAPAAPERLPLPIPSISAGNQGIPLNSAGKTAVPPPASPKIPVPLLPAFPAAKIAPGIPLPARKKFIACEDLAKIFNGGGGLTRKAAVSALKALGFGKTAAYAALSPDGRFSARLQFAQDGMIAWKALP